MRVVLAMMALLLSACSQGSQSTSTAAASHAPRDANPGVNGESIFMTGRDAAGVQLTAQHPPLRPSCSACHGVSGEGGVHLPGGAVSADLRHAALVTHQKPPYTVALLERAISRGIDNQGHPLNPVMPHWTMSARHLHDVAPYVFTKLK